MGSPSFGLRSPSKEPCGIRKYPGGVFSRKAVADLFGQAMNGERGCGAAAKLKTNPQVGFHERPLAAGDLAACGRRWKLFLVETRAEPRVSKGDFAICGWRLRALP